METKKPIAILLSKVGKGKTSIYNKLCNQSEIEKPGGESCTRGLFLKCTSYGKGFYLMDTPGFGCDEDIITHLSALFVATERPLNAILILTKYDRTCLMKEEISQALCMLSASREIIIIIVTFCDDIENQSIEYQELKRGEIQEKVMKPLKLKSFICTSKRTPGDLICNQLDQLIQNNLKKSVQLSPQEFSFQFSKLTSFTIDEEMETSKLTHAFQKKCDTMLKFIEQQPDDTQKTSDLMHEIILLIKEEAHKSVMEFTSQNREKFDRLVGEQGICERTYLAHTKLKAEILGELDEVIQKAQEKMQTYKYHVYNFIKQCPYCGIIWFKVSGCNDITNCGGKPSKDEKNLAPQPKKYKVIFNGPQLEVIDQCGCWTGPQVDNKTQVKKTANLQGCGAQLDWKELPPLSDDLIKELKDTGFLDVLSMIQDKDRRDIENEQGFWERLEELQIGQRQSVNQQIQQENQIQEQKSQKQKH